MAQPKKSVIEGARAGMRRLAGRETPLVRNEWYVAAFASEIGRTLLARTLLERPIVMFRTEDGVAQAFDNRCPHRSFPLSAGYLEGDTLVCGYHGMRFDRAGDCIDLPAIEVCPRGIGVRRYPLVESGGLIWIWLGDPGLADPAKIVGPAWLGDPQWAGGNGYFMLEGSYVSLHENLLDTSHLSFLHANTIGSPDYVKAPFTTEIGDDRFALDRVMYPTQLPAILARLTGLEGVETIARAVRNEFFAPSFYEATTRIYDASVEEDVRKTFTIRAGHFPTPETRLTTHYFIVVARNFGQDDDVSRDGMVKSLMAAFEEDVIGLKLQEEAQRAAGENLFEVSFPSDSLTLAMRRYLKSRADAELEAA